MCVRISNANLLRSDFPCIFAVPVVCSLLLLPLLHRFGSICWLWLIYKICFEAPHLTHGPELIPLDKIPASAFNCCTFAAHFPPGPVPHSAQANGRQLIGWGGSDSDNCLLAHQSAQCLPDKSPSRCQKLLADKASSVESLEFSIRFNFRAGVSCRLAN